MDPISDEHNIGPYLLKLNLTEPQKSHTESQSDDDPPSNAPDSISMPQRPSTPEPPAEPPVDNHPITVHCIKRNVGSPGEWWVIINFQNIVNYKCLNTCQSQ